jgi:NTP pyrophosphatase (non-canonical NTP hydrolase)
VPNKTIRDWQNAVDAWLQGPGAGYWSPHVNVARLAEEVGELARLINHLYGPKPKKTSEAPQELGEELADILFVIVCMANAEGIDLETSFQGVLDKVWQRDRNRFRG